MQLDTPISDIAGVGPVYINRLIKLNINTVYDLLHHYPFRYEDYSVTTPSAQAQIGQTVTIRGKIHSARNDFTKNGKRMQKVQIFDGTGIMLLIFFNQPYLIQSMKKGEEMAASGQVKFFGRNKAIIGPEYEMIYDRDPIHTGRLVPVYPETAGISSKWLRSKIALLLKRAGDDLLEYLPDKIIKSQKLTDYKTAVHQIHFPDNQIEANNARQRLAFDELFLTLLASQIRKKQWQEEKSTYNIKSSNFRSKISDLISNLPFTLTKAQERCTDEILKDLEKNKPMNRLLQGDVGSGKTVVSAISMYAAYLAGYKSVLMAPTEILANQHFKTIKELFKPYNIAVTLITSSTSKRQRSEILNLQSDISVGTHALLYNQKFNNLALVIIDEQHRFGVKQRTKLKKQGIHPHLLSMTATPIPRSYALVLHSELDLSYIDEMPIGRKETKTWLVPNEKRKKAYEWIKIKITNTKDQAFVICPLIEESEHETLQTVKSAKAEYEKLQKVYPALNMALIHGKIKPKEKETILSHMAEGDIDILVATPIVEVGIDIPNATIMLIEASDRFGLAQLHQLRGRIGRNDRQSYCLLFTESTSMQARKRLRYLESIENGAELSEIDMKLRGSGDLYGTRQSGFSDFKLASLTDTALLTKSRQAVTEILSNSDTLPSRLHDRIQDYIIQDISQD